MNLDVKQIRRWPSSSQLDAWAEELGHGPVVADHALPTALLLALQTRARQVEYSPAAVGRANSRRHEASVRQDEICWTNSTQAVDAAWLAWLDNLQQGLNERLFLGLQQHESHYAHYAPGGYYQRHQDAFRGQGGSAGITANRVVSLVLYLHDRWPRNAGGELMLFVDETSAGRRVLPVPGRLVLFMSEQTPHQVLPGQQHRYSLAAWFRRGGVF